MTVNIRWVTKDGQQQLSVSWPGGPFLTMKRETAWELIWTLGDTLFQNPPPIIDNNPD